MPEKIIEPMDYESAFSALQDVISRLENTELPLEEALRLYEEGKRLSGVCTAILESAQLRVSTLSETQSEPDQTELSEPF